MQQELNPYRPGAGRPPPALTGRDQELDAFDFAIRRFRHGASERSMILTGLRGVGKTVLLAECARIAERYDWACEGIEAREGINLAEEMAVLTRKALFRFSAGERAKEWVKQAFGVLRSFQIRWKLPEGGEVEMSLPEPGRGDSGVLDHDLTDLFVAVGEAARERETGVIFTLDEMQFLAAHHLGGLCMALHKISQKELPLLLVGAGLPSLPGLLGEAKSYTERLFEFRVINGLEEGAARAALTAPAEKHDVCWTEEALNRIIEATKNYPYFLQEFGKGCWNVATGPDRITEVDVTKAYPIIINALDEGFFRVRLDRVTPAEREYLIAMAETGSGPYMSGDVAKRLGKTHGQVGVQRTNLIKRGLCYAPSHGVIDFTVPLFDEFIRRVVASS